MHVYILNASGPRRYIALFDGERSKRETSCGSENLKPKGVMLGFPKDYKWVLAKRDKF